MAHLPTVDQILGRTLDDLDTARSALSDAASWLRSDWSPPDAVLTDAQSTARTATFAEIDAAKAAIDRAKQALRAALP